MKSRPPQPIHEALPSELILLVASRLPDASIAALEASTSWFRDTMRGKDGENFLWRQKCEELRRTKQMPALERSCEGGSPPPSSSSWRARYVSAVVDSRRSAIRHEEVCSSRWGFRFRHDHAAMHRPPQESSRGQERPPAELHFSEDGYYSSSMPGAPSQAKPLPWRLVTPPRAAALARRTQHAAGPPELASPESSHYVRIASYPLLRTSRDPNSWGWKMANRFVEFYTTRPEEGQEPR